MLSSLVVFILIGMVFFKTITSLFHYKKTHKKRLKSSVPSAYLQSNMRILHDNLQNEVVSYLNLNDMFRFSLTSKLSKTFFEPNYLNLLLNGVVRGEKNKVEKILKLYPELLLRTGRVKDYSGRIIHGTALQIALGAEDVSIHAAEKRVVELILDYLLSFSNGKEVINKQIRRQFPPGWQAQEASKLKAGCVIINQAFNEICNATKKEDCMVGIENFKIHWHKQSVQVIRSGRHFNAKLLLYAYHQYKNQYKKRADPQSYKNNLLAVHVVGFIQRYVTACLARDYCGGLLARVIGGSDFEPGLNFFEGGAYFPLDKNSKMRLGFDFYIGATDVRRVGIYPKKEGLAWRGNIAHPALILAPIDILDDLISKKSALIDVLINNAYQQVTSNAEFLFKAPR